MSTSSQPDRLQIPNQASFITQGSGSPVVLVHGLAASLHDWDALVPELVEAGYSTYAVDLLGHGDSPKPGARLYEMDWMIEHFAAWMHGLPLLNAPVLIGHSLGGYIALEYARRYPERVRGLVLVDPFYDDKQLPWGLRLAYSHPSISGFFLGHTPRWLVRWGIDIMSLLMGHSRGGAHALSEAVRNQTAIDYLRTSPAAYGILRAHADLTPYLASISAPTLLVWGDRDRTLAPASFTRLAGLLPQATGRSRLTGHVPHQAEAEWFGREVLDFLGSLPPVQQDPKGALRRDILPADPGA